MIEPLLYFTLGFLCAAFIAALVAPAVWRRGVMLTTRRIEASIPLTLDEIRADKDSLKAEHAVEMRKLEMDIKALTERMSEQSVRIARDGKEMKAFTSERSAIKQELSGREADTRQARDELRRREEGMQALSSALARTEEMLQAQRADFARLGKDYEETSYLSSARQIELVAREAEIERLNSELSTLRGRRRDVEKLHQEADSAIGLAKTTASAEKKRADSLDAKLLKLMADLSDREEKIERRERELARLREKVKALTPASKKSDFQRLIDLQAENMRLEAKVTELTAAPGQISPDNAAASDKLRDEMHRLAAEVVHMTQALEGPDSAVDRALAKPDPEPARPGAPVSLADRIRSLRKSAGQSH